MEIGKVKSSINRIHVYDSATLDPNLLDDLTGWAGIYLTDPAVTGLASFDYLP